MLAGTAVDAADLIGLYRNGGRQALEDRALGAERPGGQRSGGYAEDFRGLLTPLDVDPNANYAAQTAQGAWDVGKRFFTAAGNVFKLPSNLNTIAQTGGEAAQAWSDAGAAGADMSRRANGPTAQQRQQQMSDLQNQRQQALETGDYRKAIAKRQTDGEQLTPEQISGVQSPEELRRLTAASLPRAQANLDPLAMYNASGAQRAAGREATQGSLVNRGGLIERSMADVPNTAARLGATNKGLTDTIANNVFNLASAHGAAGMRLRRVDERWSSGSISRSWP